MSKYVMMVLERKKVNEIRIALEELGYYDNSRTIMKTDEIIPSGVITKFAVPVTDACKNKFVPLQDKPLPHLFSDDCVVCELDLLPSKKSLALQENPHIILQKSLFEVLCRDISCEKVVNEMINSVPRKWERHSDMIVFPPNSFATNLWQSYFDSLSMSQSSQFWSGVSRSLKCERLAVDSKVNNDSFRSSGSTLLLGGDGWVDHVDNGIHYIFDVTKCIFSSGNITEKLRISRFDCEGETVVDLYAGIGYFVLPYLVHSKAKLVHACEWNLYAIEGLKRGLKANGVENRCIMHFGDCKEVNLKNIADRVNLGLIPSCEDGWPTACAALKSTTGGWLHIHGIVSTKPPRGDENDVDDDQELRDKYLHLLSSKSLRCISVMKWICHVSKEVLKLLEDINNQQWVVEVKHVERVKIYAPHVNHLVLDLECRPISCCNYY